MIFLRIIYYLCEGEREKSAVTTSIPLIARKTLEEKNN